MSEQGFGHCGRQGETIGGRKSDEIRSWEMGGDEVVIEATVIPRPRTKRVTKIRDGRVHFVLHYYPLSKG